MTRLTARELSVVKEAESILYRTMKQDAITIHNTAAATKFVNTVIGHLDRENFLVIFLDVQHKIDSYDVLFKGSIDCATVHPRVIMQEVLKRNSAAIIIAHNHPSGSVTPSAADKAITARIVEAGKLLDIQVLDHIVVAGIDAFSFQENLIMPQ